MDSGLGHTLHPGPIDDSVLTLQDHHRSTDIWNGQEFDPLTCRRCDGHFWRLGPLDPRVQKVLLKAGFYGVYKAGRIRLDHALITALVERWRPETHTFHFPVGEATVTLQDIAVLCGLPVDGDPITGVDTNRTMDEWQGICNELLGFRPPPEDFDRGRLKIRCLQERFKVLPDDASEDTVQFYARAYILQLLGGQLLSDMSNNKVKLMYLPLLRDLGAAGKMSWGSAVLSCLYRALCRASKPETSDICGPLVLLQIWAWERIPFIRPGRLTPRQQSLPDTFAGGHLLPAAPYGSRWNVGFKLESVGTHVLVLYRDQLDNMKDDQFIWEPYPVEVLASLPEYCLSGNRIWQTVAPLICFDVVEFHHPDRVLRQFGQQQTIPAVCDTIPDIHLTDRRGRQNYDWANHHRQFVDMWAERCARVISTPPIERPMDQSDPYMVWYRQITRLLIGNPATRPNTRYHHGGSMEAMIQSLQKICHRASEAIQEGYDVPGEDVLREIRDICVYSLRAAHEDHRLTIHTDLASPSSAAASPFIPPPKVQRGRPKKRGGFTGRRGSYMSVSTPMGVPHSPMPSNIGDVADTPRTWDSSMSVPPEFHDSADPNSVQVDSEESNNPFLQALGKIRDICAFTLQTNGGDQSVLSTHDMIPVGPKMKRCRPRRRGGMTGYLLGSSSGANSYFPYTPGQESTTPSASMGVNGSPSCEMNYEPLVTPLSRDMQMSDLHEHDNLQSEMIELDTITGSREASPSMLNLPHCGSSANQNAPPVMTEQEKNRGMSDEILPPVSDPTASEPREWTVKPDSDEPEKFNEARSPQGGLVDSEPNPEPEHKVSPAHLHTNEVFMEVNGPGNHSISEPITSEPQAAEIPTQPDLANPEAGDSKPITHQNDENTLESSQENEAIFVHSDTEEQEMELSPPKHQEHSVSGEPVAKGDGPEADVTDVVSGKRKGEALDKVGPTESTPVSSHDTDTVNASGKSPVKVSPELDRQVINDEAGAAKDGSPKTYKRQRRSTPKPRS